MSRYWVIAPYDSTKPQIFDTAWKYDLENQTIALGWTQLGDISKLSRPEIESRYRSTYSDAVAKHIVTKDANALWALYHEISPGDVVIARRGTKRIVGVGTVMGTAFYDEERGRTRVAHQTDQYYANFIPVQWEAREILFDKAVFSFYTIHEIPEEKYQSIIAGIEDGEEAEEAIEASAEFVLEKYLEDFIVANFDSIFKGELKLYEDPEGNIGQQYLVTDTSGKSIGRIDILARESNGKGYVVIELKKGRESDQVIGQTLRYMGWVKDNLSREGEAVSGLIICKDVEDRLTYALKMVQGLIRVKRYRINFQLSDV